MAGRDAAFGGNFGAGLAGSSEEATLRRLNELAYWLDERFRLPGLNVRVGIDGLLGLIPGIGDLAGGAISAYILYEAWRLDVPNRVLARMLANLGVDVVVGSVPLFGDLFDIGWKANRRNVNLLVRHLQEVAGRSSGRRS